MKFSFGVALAFMMAFTIVSNKINPAPAVAAPVQVQAKAPCVDYNQFYTCESAKAASGLRAVENMMGSRHH